MRKHGAVALLSLLLGVLLGVFGVRGPGAEEAPFTRTLLLEADLEGIPGKRILLMDVRLAGGAATGKHTHPGQEFACVIEGEGVLTVEGKDPQRMRAGEASAVPYQAVHEGRNADASRPLRLIVALIVDRDRPPATPAPESR